MDVVVDQPACTLWNVILSQFPDAKVILMERDSEESWVKSYRGMLNHFLQFNRPWLFWLYPWLSDTHSKLDRLAKRNMISSTAADQFTCTDAGSALWKDQYMRHNAAVKQLVPASQLLVYKIGEDWERLCEFLSLPVPEEEFPHENKAGSATTIDTQYIQFDVFRRGDKEVQRSLVGILGGLALCAWWACRSR